ncbi:hypothetical protein G7075_13845 [Phycicoccus sp. HDW14]|uniref:hypothetical protein n=1 Tax=Phycicoccus sp. HDW14 TaxID=2714941 RepID=UPI0014091B69|nr:hypothetical protein [Phycicoccus sp. HDW14]QIM21961.1 hypothetical protein G7075_13845 [Phycicoccus sp. HDW14]
MSTRAASALRFAGLAAAALLASGCAVFSPTQTDYPYLPADGVDLTVPGLTLRNVAIVAGAQGSPGVIVGQAVNDASDAVDVAFALEGTQGATTSVPAYSGTTLSTATTKLEVGNVPVAPGAMVQLTVTTREAGQNVVLVPVLAPDRYYSDLAVSPSASPTPSPTSS